VVDLFEALRPFVEREDEDQDDDQDEEGEGGPLKLAIVGRPNAGKSTLVNQMLGQERMITGPEAGITRDSIAIEWEWQGRSVRLIDTAGLRRRSKVEDKLERLSAADTRRAVDFAEVVVLLLDATRGLEAQDLRIADAVVEEGRALIVALNKWDVAEGASALFNGVKAALEEGLSQLRGVPLLTVSAKTGKGIDTSWRSPSSFGKPGRGASRPASSTAGSSARSTPIRRRRPAASASSCATSPR
jgi:GTP-binding protein